MKCLIRREGCHLSRSVHKVVKDESTVNSRLKEKYLLLQLQLQLRRVIRFRIVSYGSDSMPVTAFLIRHPRCFSCFPLSPLERETTRLTHLSRSSSPVVVHVLPVAYKYHLSRSSSPVVVHVLPVAYKNPSVMTVRPAHRLTFLPSTYLPTKGGVDSDGGR